MQTFMVIMVSLLFLCVAWIIAMGVDIDKPAVPKPLEPPKQTIRKEKRRRH